MPTRTRTISLAVALAILVVAVPRARDQIADEVVPVLRGGQGAKPAEKPIIPTKVDVVLTRMLGEKRVGVLPFTLWVTSNSQQVSVRMGVDVPIGASTVTAGRVTPTSSNGATSTTSETSTKVEYRNVGTSIDCRIEQLDDGRFNVYVNVQDSSVFTADVEGRAALKAADPMAFRTFTMSNRLILRDGQTQQFTMATDKISGETLKVDVTLNVIK